MHPRQEIREAVVAILKGATSVGNRVFKSRLAPFFAPELPCIAVYTVEETADDQRTAPRVLYRKLTLAVEIFAKVNDDLDDVLDGIASQVEAVLFQNDTLNDMAADCVLASTKIVFVEEKGDRFIGAASMHWTVEYTTPAPDEVILPDLTTVSTGWDLAVPGEDGSAAKPDGVVDALDTLSIEFDGGE